MSQMFTFENNKLIVDNLVLKNTEGNVIHDGHVDVTGNVSIGYNLKVEGTITADTFNVKNLVTEQGSLASVGDWTYNTEEELNGKGFNWTWGGGNTTLVYRSGKLWSNSSIDLKDGNSFMIDGLPVISAKELGPQITKSNLKEIGTLRNLTVTGDAEIGQFAVFNSTFGRLGLNTSEPNSALSIADNDIEIVLGSPDYGQAFIGTYTNHDLSIGVDNTAAFTIKNTGGVVFGNSMSKNANVVVHGTLTVDNLVSDTRLDRYSPLEFKSSKDGDIYGKGLLWTTETSTRQFVLLPKPDRLYSSESIDLATGQSYYINARPVITETALGESIVDSKLSSVGTLTALTVSGEASFLSTVSVSNALRSRSMIIDNGTASLSINGSKLNSNNNVTVAVAEDEVLYADVNEIIIGNKINARRSVKVHGPLSVGVSNPDPTVDLTVKGNVSFANKKFITGLNAPTTGTYNAGDICWNEVPQTGNYVGWVCINTGAPGVWAPFGAIGK